MKNTKQGNKYNERSAGHGGRKKINAKRTLVVFCALLLCVAMVVGIPFIGHAEDALPDQTGLQAVSTDNAAEPEDTGEDILQEGDPAAQSAVAAVTSADLSAPQVAAAAANETPEESEVYHTVTFMVNDEVYHEASVLDGTLVAMPSDPQSDAPFLAWYTADGSSLFRPSTPISSDMTLVATFSEQHIVRYMDTDGSELEAIVVNDGEAAPQPSRQPYLSMGSSLLYWSDTAGGGEYSFGSPVTSGLTLYPVTNSRAMAVFVTNGPEVDPQTGSSGFTASQPDDSLLVRDGYTFSHWSATENGEQHFDFAGTPITGTTFIYAVWTPDNVGYIINYWNEKANIEDPGDPSVAANRSNYEMVYTKVIDAENGAQAGSKPQIDAAFADANYVSGGSDVTLLLDYSDYVWTDEKDLSGFGTTVINVYYQRTEYSFTFDLTKATDGSSVQGWIKLRGNDEKIYGEDGLYTIEGVKLGQDISTIWPLETGRDDSTTTKPVAWNSLYGCGTLTVSPWYLQQAFNGGKTGRPTGESATLKMNWKKAGYLETRYYYTEIPEGQEPGENTVAYTPTSGSDRTTRYYELSEVALPNYQSSNPETAAKGWPGRAIEGFETITTSLTGAFQQIVYTDTVDGVKNYDLNYYMRRQSYNLTLVTNGGTIADENGFTLSDGNYTKKFQYEAALSLTSDPEKANAKFDGWYMDELFQVPFDPSSTMPARNLTLYAKFVGTDVTVNYYVGGILPIKTNTYALNQPLTAHYLDGTQYAQYNVGDTVPGKGIFRGWYYEVGDTGLTVDVSLDMRLTRSVYNLYADFEPLTYTVTYVSQNGSGEEYEFTTAQVVSGTRNTLALQGYYENGFTPVLEGHTFKNWNTMPDGSGTRFTTATRVLDDITVYAQWTPQMYNVLFESNGGTQVEGQQVAYKGNATQPEQPQKDGFTFEGWYADAALGTAWQFDSDTVTSDITLYAKWSPQSGVTPEETAGPDDDTAPENPAGPGTDPTDPGDGTKTPAAPEGAGTDTNNGTSSQTEDNDSPAFLPAGVEDGATPSGGGDTATTPQQIASEDMLSDGSAGSGEVADASAVQAPSGAEDGQPLSETLGDAQIPLYGQEGSDTWALLNLIACIGGAALAAIVAITAIVRRNKKEDEDNSEDKKRKKLRPLWLILAIVMGIAGVVAFLLTENMHFDMVWTDSWTPLMVILLAVGMISTALVFYKKKDSEDTQTPDYVEA